MDTENLIREALRRQAERAPEPDRVRQVLLAGRVRRAERRRYGWLVATVTATAAVAATVAVPVLALRSPRDDVHGAVGSIVAGAASEKMTSTAERYSPTWLPPGLSERSRQARLVNAEGQQLRVGIDRVWVPDRNGRSDGGGPRLSVDVADGTRAPDVAGATTRVDVNGKPGTFHEAPDGSKSFLQWMPDPHTVMSIEQMQLGLGLADLARVARSVQPTATRFDVPLRVRRLPDGLVSVDSGVSGESAASWQFWKTWQDHATHRIVQVSMGTVTSAPAGGQELTVGDQAARFVTRDGDASGTPYQSYLVVDHGAGQVLTVTVSDEPSSMPNPKRLSSADIVSIAESVEVGRVDLTWLPSR